MNQRGAWAGLACALLWGCAEGSDANIDESDDDGAVAATSGAGGSSTSASSAGGGSTTSGAGGAAECPVPSGTVGIHAGELVDPALSWQGYPGSATQPETIAATDYYDCDGSRGIHAWIITQSAMWCGPCQIDATTLESKLAGEWSELGVRALTLMVEQNSEQPATVQTAQMWKQSLGLTEADVAADPDYTFDAFDFDKHISPSGFPLHLLVDPRTMTIVGRFDGVLPLAEAQSLATTNQP